jgi:hypothetical protein
VINRKLYCAEDADKTGTCYSLDVMVTANYGLRRDIIASWKELAGDPWQFKAEAVATGPAGPEHVWKSMTFGHYGDRALQARRRRVQAVAGDDDWVARLER